MANSVIYNHYEMDHEGFLSNLNENLTIKTVNELKNEDFVSGFTDGKIKFLSVVESIQGVLTNTNVDIREKGLEFLSWILVSVPPVLFNETEISVVSTFFCNSLKGHHNVIPPTVKGLNALIRMQNINKEDIIKVLVHLFQNVTCQSQLQPDRYNLFLILKYVIENYLDYVKLMGPDFVYGVISFIEGESDPSCLHLVFNFIPNFLNNFGLGHLTEEMFEVLSCYFPIDFNSAAKDSTLVTREDLAQGLLQCLSATNLFCQLCLPMIFEKLDSTFKTAKLDSYELLQECCKRLNVENVKDHLNKLWKFMVKDILPGNDIQVCDYGLTALTDIIKLLSKEESNVTLSSFLDDVLTSVKSVMNNVDENMYQSAVRVLIAVSAPSKIATARVLCQLKPFYSLHLKAATAEKKILLSSVMPFLKFCSLHKLTESNDSELQFCYLELVNLYLHNLDSSDSEVRKFGFMGILECLDFNKEIRRKLYEIVTENIKTKDDIKNSKEFMTLWRQFAQDYPEEIDNILSESFSFNVVDPHVPQFLWALSLIADLPSFIKFVVGTFVNVIQNSKLYDLGFDCILNACRIAQKNASFQFFNSIHFEQNIFEQLMTWWIETKCKEEELLLKLTEIIALIVRNQSSTAQQSIVDRFVQKYFNEHLPVGSGDCSIALLGSNGEVTQDVLVLEAVLGSVKPEITIPLWPTISEKLIDGVLRSHNALIRLSLSRLLASIVNKSKDPSEILSKVSENVFKALEEETELQVKLNAAFLFTWILKGIILSGSSFSEKWITTWFELFGRKDVGEVFAEGFESILAEDSLYLNLESHCIVRVLYRQRLFGHYPKLKCLYDSSDESVKMNYLLAIIRMLKGVPIHIIQTEITNIGVLLLRCLDTDKPDVLLTSLEIVAVLLENKTQSLKDYVQSFVTQFLRLSKFEGHMKIRINSLRCLYSLAFYPTVTLLPFKNRVIRDLEHCLDDKKRLVRKEAVRARCRWYLVGAPGEDILIS